MKALIYNSAKEAADRSRSAWEAVLGRKKRSQDITEFLWPARVREQDGKAALMIDDIKDSALLTAAEKDAMITEESAARDGF